MQQHRRPKNPPEDIGRGIFDRQFFRDNFRLEGASDVISGADVGRTGMDVHVKNIVILGRTALEIIEPLTL